MNILLVIPLALYAALVAYLMHILYRAHIDAKVAANGLDAMREYLDWLIATRRHH